ncbi:beta strand repeat-containing protein [Nocardioides caeni]|nr:Ig-like domain-containing protein [Nocardioides caeni]
MRRLIAALAAFALAVGLPVALMSPASADLTAPANGAVLRGNATLSASGGSDGSLCITGSAPRTILRLINSANQVVFEETHNGAGAKSSTIDTHNYPNGAYTVRAVERRRSGTVFCSSSESTFNRSVTIDNITQLAYSGDVEGAQNTSATVRATLTDPNLSSSVLPGRTVTFSLSGGTSVNAVTDANGVATASLPLAGPPRSATVTASFAQTTHYKGSTATAPFTVSRNDSTTTLVPPTPVVHGEAVSFTAQVARVDGTSTPTGTVQFTVDGADFGPPATVSGGVAASISSSTLSTGNHTIGAHYSGDGNLAPSTATSASLVVDKAGTTTALTSTGSPTVSGEAVTFTAEVDVVSPGVGQPAGGVQFNVDGQPYGTAVALSGSGVATLTISNLLPGNHTVGATYNGNADFASSAAADLTHGVDLAATTVAVTTSNASAVAGEPLTFTADIDVVAPGAGDPSGTVQFSADGEAIGAPVAVSGGTAVSPPVGLDAGDHVITADYSGDDRFAGSNDTLDQEVEAGQTTTVTTTSPSPSVVGQAVTVRASVTALSPATGTPQGAVQFTIDGAAGPFATLVDGEAEFTTTTLTRGSHEISAKYLSADPNFVTSTSAAVSHTVNKASTNTTVTSSAPVSVWGQPVTFTAEVVVDAPGVGSPTGTVTFTDGPTVIGTAEVGPGTGGVASITTDELAVGQHAVVATYAGDGDFQGSDASVAQKVQKAQTDTIVSSSGNPAPSGASVTFTATVSPIAPGAGDPTGTVRFTVNGANLGSPVAVVDGVATSPAFSATAPGTYRIAAVYSGNPQFVGSTGLLDQGNGQTVTKGSTTLDLSADAELTAQGDPVTFTATVIGAAPAEGRPTGAVQFWEGTTLLGSASLQPASASRTSTASFTTTSLAPGEHEIRAVYAGNANYNGQTGTTSHVVGVAPTTTGITSDASPITFGDSVTFTATVSDAVPVAGDPTGTVTFRDGDAVLGTADLQTVDGQQEASLVVEGLAAGSHEITATYSGDATRGASTSPVLVQVVDRMASRMTDQRVIRTNLELVQTMHVKLTAVDGTALAGQSIVFSSTAPVNGYRVVCTGVTGANGVAECRIPSGMTADVRNHGFTATFGGNASHLPTSGFAHN